MTSAEVAYGDDIHLHYFPDDTWPAGLPKVAMCGAVRKAGSEEAELHLMLAGEQAKLCEECLTMLRELDVDPFEVSTNWEVGELEHD